MEIFDYFTSDEKEYWLGEIKKSDWVAGQYLYELLRDGKMKQLCGETTKVLLLVEGRSLMAFCTFAEQDDVCAPDITPWVGFVYTFPAFRGKRRMGKLMEYAYALAKEAGFKQLYISTGETGLYEKYGFTFWKLMKDVHGADSRIYRRDVVTMDYSDILGKTVSGTIDRPLGSSHPRHPEMGDAINVGGITFPSNVLMAPLAGYTCFPFRLMAKKLGAGSAYTEMVSADGLKYNDRATSKLLYTDEREKTKCVQLLGAVPAVFERAVKSERLEPFDVIDINMGCPVPNVVKAGEGCGLMEDIPRASKIIEACKRSGKVVSVKCRLGMNRQKIVIEEFARMCEASGADMITVHGRTRDMMYDGEPLYDYIRLAKQVVKIPVFANGGIDSKEKAQETLEKTGADGIMLARYGFENPLIFAELTGKKCDETKLSLITEQLELAGECFDELFVLTYIKKLASYFMKKLPGTKQYKLELYKCGSTAQLRNILNEIFTA